MGTLKSTIKIESTDLFPTPVSFTVVNNNAVNGTFSGFNNVVAGTAGIQLNLASIDTATAYVYAQAPTTNGTAVGIREVGGPTVFAVLAPGDVAFFPYGQTAGGGADLEAFTTGGTASINFFIGEKA
jgi:hypothetical protein